MTARPRPSERSVLEVAAAHLSHLGYRTYLDPDGGSYFDLAAVRGEEVGLVEGKVGETRRVLRQALERRLWADWVAVVVPSAVSAERLVARTSELRASSVGVWVVRGDRVDELRAATPRVPTGPEDPYAPLKRRLLSGLAAIDRGESPDGVRWSGVPGEVRRAGGGRRFSEWRLDERVD